MNHINILPDSDIVKIAAGEIIENPASIIKELVENSIDAKASDITIEIENNGKDLIKVTDNGHGFMEEDLDIAFKRHATSKINKLVDLKDTNTLGFRGEALSSIAYASNVEIISKNRNDKLATYAKVDMNGNIIKKEKLVSQDGTIIICKDLFSNLPVRRIYLENKAFEISKTNEIISKLALSSSQISLKYYKDNKLILKTDPDLGIKNNIYSILGGQVSDNLIYIDEKLSDFSIKGYISNNRIYKSNRKNQYLFVNKRSIVSKELSSAIERAYSTYIPINRFPVFVLHLDIDNYDLDVNIHPKKDQIKFTKLDSIKKDINKLILEKLNENLKILEFSSPKEDKKEKTIIESLDINKEKLDESSLKNNNSQAINFLDYSNTLNNPKKDTPSFPNIDIREESLAYNNYTQGQAFDLDNEIKQSPLLPNGYRYIGSFLNKYILLEDSQDKNLYFLDQHAAHERINYEKLKRQYENQNINVQNLISSYIINLSVDDYQYILSIKDELYNLGIDLDDFGQNSIILRTVPAYLNDLNPDKFLGKILEDRSTYQGLYDFDPYKIMKMACSSSIKSGDYINKESVQKLIEDLNNCDMPLTCPHGRPTIVKLSENEIDKEFFRIQND